MVNFLKSERGRFPGAPDFVIKALTGIGSVRRSIAVADWVFSLGFAMLPPSATLAEAADGTVYGV